MTRWLFGALLAPLLVSMAWASPGLRVGVAEAEITPRVGVPLAGYGGRIRKQAPDLNPFNDHALFEPSRGVRDPIEAQCLVIEQGAQRVALVTIDAIGVEQQLVSDLLRAIQARGVPLQPGQLFMTASHTHSGPGTLSRRLLWQLAACDRFRPRVHRRLIGRLAGLVEQAWNARVPARLAEGTVDVPGVSRNRRASRSALVEPESVDQRLRLLRIDDAEGGGTLAVLLSYAIHPTCLGDDNLEFSADVVGAIRRKTRQRLGVPVLFANGCEGDVAPSPGGERGIESVGERLADAAVALAPQATALGTSLALAEVERDLGPLVLHPRIGEEETQGVARTMVEAVKRLGPRLREPVLTTRFRYAVIRLGDLVLLFVPGEPIVSLGQQLEALARAQGFRRVWVVGLANGHMGYVCTPEEYDQGGYEAWLTFYGRDTADRLREAFSEALSRVAPY